MYKSIKQSFSGDFELVVVGPYDPPEEFTKLHNTKFIKDFGCPTRCQQIALIESQGEYTFLGADDGLFFPNSLDKCFDALGDGYKDVIIAKYTEGEVYPPAVTGEYWHLHFHKDLRTVLNVDGNWYVANNMIMRREYILDLGGYDCRFETTPHAVLDLGIRAQRDKANCKLSDHVVMHCEHQPGESGDHGPVHRCGLLDYERFIALYANENVNCRINIDINNWLTSPSIWDKRNF